MDLFLLPIIFLVFSYISLSCYFWVSHFSVFFRIGTMNLSLLMKTIKFLLPQIFSGSEDLNPRTPLTCWLTWGSEDVTQGARQRLTSENQMREEHTLIPMMCMTLTLYWPFILDNQGWADPRGLRRENKLEFNAFAVTSWGLHKLKFREQGLRQYLAFLQRFWVLEASYTLYISLT